MQISAPLYVLKRRAKLAARQTDKPLHHALDMIAQQEGFQSWSHLSAASSAQSPASRLLSEFSAGSLVLLGARPGHGKTLLGLELAMRAPQIGRVGSFFTLDYHARDVADRLATFEIDQTSAPNAMLIDTSDLVSADYIIRQVEADTTPQLIVVDYLQLLDQRRANPSLAIQMTALQKYVQKSGAICAVISQIDRSFDLADRSMPDVADIRLPNPFDLSVFDAFCFLHNGRIQLKRAA